MSTLKHRILTLVAVLAVAGAGCSGDKGPAGAAGTNGNDGTPGTSGTNGVNGGVSTGLVIAVSSVTANADGSVSVRFTLKDDQGFPVDVAGKYSKNTAFTPRFALTQITQDANGIVQPYNVLTKSGSSSLAPTAAAPDPATVTVNPTAMTPLTPAVPATSGALVENGSGNGDYTYTFATGGMTSAPGTGSNAGKTTYTVAPAVQLDPTSAVTHSVWIQASRQTNLNDANDPKGFKATNFEYRFVPNGSGTALKREIVSTAACYKCHNGFKAQSSLASGGFHGYGRNEGPFCNVCHNQARQSGKTNSDGATPAAASSVFVHRIHNAKNLQAKTSGQSTIGYQGSTACTTSKPCTTCSPDKPCVLNAFDGVTDTTYPQDLRNCSACHSDNAAQHAQALNNPSRAACGSCHDYVDFAGTAGLPFCAVPNAKDANGAYVPCIHTPGAQTNDAACAGCHTPAGGSYYVGDKHVAVAPVDDGNILLPVSGTGSTATAGYQGGTLTSCGTGTPAPCVCSMANPCYDPVKFSLVVTTQTKGQVLMGGTACGTGFLPSLKNQCDCSSTPCIGAGNNNTNAANMAAAGMIPAGAKKVTYAVKSVSLNSAKNPVIVFKLQLDGTDVVFNSKLSGKPELIDNFVGSPSAYFVFAVPQDGITAPADFNASASAYIKDVWNSGVTTGAQTTGSNAAGVTCTVAAPCDCTASPCYAAGANTLVGPDSSGFYTLTVAKTVLPASATMLTGGIGYTYGLSTTPPLVQTNVAGYPYTASTKQGGLLVSAPDVWAVAANFTGRRAIVETSRCNNCHAQLGAAPTFHAGQRNDGPTCSFCHNPNRTSSGWSANAKDFLHALHAGDQRSTPFNWHAGSPTEGFWDITFPDQLNHCQACHAPGTYDFSASASAAAVPNLLASTVGQGKYNGDDTTANYAFSSSVTKTTNANYNSGATDYGFGFATSKVTVSDGRTVTTGTMAVTAQDASGTVTNVDCTANLCVCTPETPCTIAGKSACSLTTPCDADATTLVTSPIMAACVACHDDPAAKAHMTGNGGSFYQPRSVAKNNVEQCLICHGPQPGAIAPIADVHW